MVTLEQLEIPKRENTLVRVTVASGDRQVQHEKTIVESKTKSTTRKKHDRKVMQSTREALRRQQQLSKACLQGETFVSQNAVMSLGRRNDRERRT